MAALSGLKLLWQMYLMSLIALLPAIRPKLYKGELPGTGLPNPNIWTGGRGHIIRIDFY